MCFRWQSKVWRKKSSFWFCNTFLIKINCVLLCSDFHLDCINYIDVDIVCTVKFWYNKKFGLLRSLIPYLKDTVSVISCIYFLCSLNNTSHFAKSFQDIMLWYDRLKNICEELYNNSLKPINWVFCIIEAWSLHRTKIDMGLQNNGECLNNQLTM